MAVSLSGPFEHRLTRRSGAGPRTVVEVDHWLLPAIAGGVLVLSHWSKNTLKQVTVYNHAIMNLHVPWNLRELEHQEHHGVL